MNTVKPPNNRHFGAIIINSKQMCMKLNIGVKITLFVKKYLRHCPLLKVKFIKSFTVSSGDTVTNSTAANSTAANST